MPDKLIGQLTTVDAARAYLQGGHATVTLVSLKTGTRFTYRVSEAPPKPGSTETKAVFFVSVLNGPENTADYAYLGLWLPKECRFFRTAKSRVASDDAPSFQAFRWMLSLVFGEGRMPATLEVWHEGSCARCGRPLTVPESIASGLGPVCAAKGA